MYKAGSRIVLSATDLSFFMGCAHAAWLDLEVIRGNIAKPVHYPDPALDALKIKGQKFESEYIAQLEKEGKTVARITHDHLTARQETLDAMKSGYDIIYQARLEDGPWAGWADFLVKVQKKSNLGDWSYEVEDTKFAKHTKAGSILQICLYSDMLSRIQGVQPEWMHITTPEKREPYRVDDYIAYFRLMQRKLVAAIAYTEEVTYPHPVELCEICKWWVPCNDRRRKDDHLAFIAGMGSSQIKEVKNWQVTTLKSMAGVPLPISHEPSRGTVQTYTRLREQARVQLTAREEKRNVHEILEVQAGIGFNQIPEPSAGDIFFDFEGDPFVGSTGREYLFGWVLNDQYHYRWALTDKEEKESLEFFVDMVMDTWHKYPGMHIYHFSAYEPSALKRLMGKYATREDEIDRLLRGKVFVDLHTILKHSVRAGVESYSLKEMERMHNFIRQCDLKTVRYHKNLYETLLESDSVEVATEETKSVVLDYNKEDCLSAKSLRDWIEQLRLEEIKKGAEIVRPPVEEDKPSENITAHLKRIQPIYDALMKDIDDFDEAERNEEQQGRWLLAHMLDWYRREEKSFWWNYHRLRELSDDELLNEKDALSGLRFNGQSGTDKKSIVHYYTFPAQDSDLRVSDKVEYADQKIGEIISLDKEKLILGIKKAKKYESVHPTHLIIRDYIPQKVKEEAIIRFAEWVIANGINAPGQLRAGRDLLLRLPPRTLGEVEFTNDAQDRAVHWVTKLDGGLLPIQGPPGTGKSHTAARMIVTLIKQGKRVGITALGHRVISELIEKVLRAASSENLRIRIVQKISDTVTSSPDWITTDDYDEVKQSLDDKAVEIVAGTAFLWAREQFAEAVDVLFVDEAGQLSLIDTLAVSHAANNLVLLGDPQQLQQPQQGHHPEGTEVSALAHVLKGNHTITEKQGVFLDVTWRMHPAICKYVSEMFYSGRLHTMPKNENQRLSENTLFKEPGIYIRSVQHEGNSNHSPEEVEEVKQLVKALSGATTSIKIIAPYNAQVNAIKTALPEIQVGTVDKFQGQEAEVIIFSMATSSQAEAPRGMDFLYSLNRLNVAVSRAKVVFILVANPALFEPDCRSPQQMKLANALCRLLEYSKFE